MASVENEGNENLNEEELEQMRRNALELIELEEKQKEAQKAKSAKPVTQTAASTVRKRMTRTRAKDAEPALQTNPEITKFFVGRESKPDNYTYTPEGNLEIKGMKGVPDKVILMSKRFVRLKPERYEELEQERLEKIKAAETTYETAIQALRSAQVKYSQDKDTSSAELVVQANQAVLDASKVRSKAAYPEVWTDFIEKEVISKILMNYDPYEKRKFPYPTYLFKHHELPLVDAWGSYEEGVPQEEEQEGGGLRIRFITDIEDKETGHFHPFTIRNFNFNGTEYCCVYQAYQAERFKELGQEELRKQVLGTRSGRTMHTIALRETTLPKTPQALWEDILFHFFHQHADLAKELEATGTDKFHVMDKQLPPEYGQALEKARLKLRELGDTEVLDKDVKERAITEDQQKKAKVGAIVNNFRRKV